MKEICANCKYFKRDEGMWTMTGWTGRDQGLCMFVPERVRVGQNETCSKFEPGYTTGKTETRMT